MSGIPMLPMAAYNMPRVDYSTLGSVAGPISDTSIDLLPTKPIDVSSLQMTALPDFSKFTKNKDGTYSMPSSTSVTTGSDGQPKVGAGAGKLGFNTPTLELGLQGLQTLGNMYAAFGQLNLAKKAYKSQKEFADINLANQMQGYNDQVRDRITTRAQVGGTSDADRDAEIARRSLSRDKALGR